MISLISLVPQVFGQISIGIPAGQDSVEIFIETDGQVHVIHEIRKGTTIQQLDTISWVGKIVTVLSPTVPY